MAFPTRPVAMADDQAARLKSSGVLVQKSSLRFLEGNVVLCHVGSSLAPIPGKLDIAYGNTLAISAQLTEDAYRPGGGDRRPSKEPAAQGDRRRYRIEQQLLFCRVRPRRRGRNHVRAIRNRLCRERHRPGRERISRDHRDADVTAA